ncbi:glucose 1-dehydrogenase [Cupriavidus pinatubonensis]|uniref:glucose 1-dehydrogenase n=1 Tax=Cupriavidus pinatubonensis TaxID=248026 RepID=UPI00112BA453|nr:glucose 1-dehydrogenase [Cupriavidus pinatubonensis]TPQ43837.1 2,5-dichloro-2,5-cyclohexadiene-1,4-diol dehydrogenase [Cupriavidus pinatubonensis]
MRMQGKIALVTGGASGMGLAFTRRLAQEGARVYFTDINGAAGHATESELQGAGLAVVFLRHDVTQENDWLRVLEHIGVVDGRLDVLVNNAGIAISHNIETCTTEDFDRTLNVNLKSVFLGCKHGLALMKQKGGSIINVSSITAICGEPVALAYSASKAGVRFLSKSVALHCAEKGYAIRVNSLHPGYIDTPLLAGSNAGGSLTADEVTASRVRIGGEIPLKRRGTPDEVAGAVLYLASDESTYVTGTELVIDGGYACH